MTFGFASTVFLLTGILMLLLLVSKKVSRKYKTVFGILLGSVCAASAVYCVLTLLLLNGIQ